jgi:hypothetical protein
MGLAHHWPPTQHPTIDPTASLLPPSSVAHHVIIERGHLPGPFPVGSFLCPVWLQRFILSFLVHYRQRSQFVVFFISLVVAVCPAFVLLLDLDVACCCG